MTYRRRKKSDVWHFHADCQHWPAWLNASIIERQSRPKSGELCNECRAKATRDK